MAESSQLFFEELQELKVFGIDRISIVAHSMGGLVSREMLTSPEFESSPWQEDDITAWLLI